VALRFAPHLGLTLLGLLSLPGYGLDLRAAVGSDMHGMSWYVLLFTGQFALYLAASWLVLAWAAHDRVALVLVLAFGLLFRLAVVPTPLQLSSDPYRYLWDGRVQHAGVNPYRYSPAAPELAHLRDERIHPNINRPTKRTIYPPGAEMLFGLVAAVAPDSLVGWRLFLLGCEIVTGGLLLRLLGRMARPPTAVILYAWAPLAIYEGVQAAHVDVAFLPPLLLALLWRQEGRMAAAGLALGAAVLIKLYPAVLLVAWWRRGEWRLPAACLAALAAGYLPYAWPVGLGVLGFLPEYFSRGEDFNIGLRWFLTAGLPSEGVVGEGVRGVAMLALFGLLAGVLVGIRRRLQEGANGVFAAAFAAAGAHLALAPTALHAWYVVWIIPFLAVAPARSWLWFSGAVTVSYLHYAWWPAAFPFWARALEFLPLWTLLIWEHRHTIARMRSAPAHLTGAVLGLLVAVALVAPPAAAQDAPRFPKPDRPVARIITSAYSTEDARDRHGEARRVMDRLGITPGLRVADVGAGDGYYTVRLARQLGAAATIYAQDVEPRYLRGLAQRLEREAVRGVRLVQGAPGDPKLPPDSVDLALLSHVYHEIENPYEFFYRLRPALARNARVAIIDVDRPTQHHGTPPDLLRCELGALGYREVDFVPLAPADGYLAIFAPPDTLPAPAAIRPCRP
jgi:SAM-dependent methyltransferase